MKTIASIAESVKDGTLPQIMPVMCHLDGDNCHPWPVDGCVIACRDMEAGNDFINRHGLEGQFVEVDLLTLAPMLMEENVGLDVREFVRP
jgi:hypothetical protein